ncbi:hypothetical protein F444_19818 [Phytophthora nicotianae P1976]|uniref:Uncharacterized protein n=1 Tax=Phytophthora nicotianae P1976 TaxID=1317066 RepID=A0A080Z6I9_PHYNI|nr:hypothetical protein F444_19818 [Phytophthora nicotianae P1976]
MSCTFLKCGVMSTFESSEAMRVRTNAAAHSALDLPTSVARNRNWRFKLDTSIVSMSIMSTLVKPESTTFFSSSHPSPPAPIIRTRHSSCRKLSVSCAASGSNSPSATVDVSAGKAVRWLNKRVRSQ